jgi:peptidoglycan L-alanyl-D-glutamate endopeptidase CwlK
MLTYTKRTVENLGSLNRKARAVLEPFFVACGEMVAREFPGVTIEIISGYRSGTAQAAIYAQGRTRPGKIVTKARPWGSWHNYGLATDAGLFKNGVYLDGKQPALADKIYRRMAELARDKFPKVECAFWWKSFPEGPHCQHTGGLKSTTAAKSRYDAVGGDIQKMI